MGVYLGVGTTVDDYSAIQGPCDSGFHIPLRSERIGVVDAYTSLGLSGGDNLKLYLKLPYAGYRQNWDAGLANQNTNGYYWTSSYDSSRDYGFYLNETSSGIYNTYSSITHGINIRPFRDETLIPDSNRTVLYQGTGTAGIYRNSTLGLISISSDGTTRYTIADKNLGATTVYSNGASLSEANCGKFYQRGNNYGFSYSGSVTTSSTQVDASNYGPGNYYSSSTRITATTRDSSKNNNLRGGVTGVQPKTVYPELKNAYIGEVIECDFTKSDYGFTYSSQGGNLNSYGRDSNGFYARCTSGGDTAGGVSWKVPSSIYSRGTLKRAEFVMLSTSSQGGGGLGTGYETKRMRHYTSNRVVWGTQNNYGSLENPTANTEWKFTVDLENKLVYSNISTPNITLALTDNAISAFNTDWTAGNVTMHCIAYSNGYTYIKSAIFYF